MSTRRKHETNKQTSNQQAKTVKGIATPSSNSRTGIRIVHTHNPTAINLIISPCCPNLVVLGIPSSVDSLQWVQTCQWLLGERGRAGVGEFWRRRNIIIIDGAEDAEGGAIEIAGETILSRDKEKRSSCHTLGNDAYRDAWIKRRVSSRFEGMPAGDRKLKHWMEGSKT